MFLSGVDTPMPTMSYYVREKVLIILAVSLSMLKILLFSIKVILSVDKSLSERNEVYEDCCSSFFVPLNNVVVLETQ